MRGISPKPVTPETVIEALNKELVPLLRELRRAVVDMQTLGGPVQAHGDTHESGGSDELAGDLLHVARAPVNYLAVLQVLDAHLDGIDDALAPYLVYIAEPGATHAFVLEDAFKTINSTGAVAATFTIPLNSVIPYPIGTVIRFLWSGAGQPTIAAAGTLIAPDGAKVSAINKFAFAEQKAADVWLMSGSCAT